MRRWTVKSVFFALSMVLAGSGCKPGHSIIPPITGGDEPGPGDASGPYYYTHHLQFAWYDEMLTNLKSLAITHPEALEVHGNTSTAELSVMITVDVQAEDHETLGRRFDRDVVSASSLLVADATLRMPERLCRKSEGDPRIGGICFRKLMISIPATKLISLDLSWTGRALIDSAEFSTLRLTLPEKGVAEVRDTAADVTVAGGTRDATVRVDGLRKGSASAGTVTADPKNLVGAFILNDIQGAISLAMPEGAASEALIDGVLVQKFPYERP